MSTSPKSLEEKLQSFKNAPEMLRNAPVGPYIFPIPSEFSNWRDEQEAWQKSVVIFDLSRHMTDIIFEGPDLMKLLSDFCVNSFEKFAPNKAKQIVCCNPDGYVIGDAILFGHSLTRMSTSGRPSVPHWLAFQAEKGGYDVSVTWDERSVSNPDQRKNYRFQVQGPLAKDLFEKVCDEPLPDIKFFNMGKLKIAGCTVNALNHGMSRTSGLELYGPSEDADKVRSALLEVGQEFGIKQAGARAYSTVSIESGWIPSPMPAIFTGEGMQEYREWLPADGFEANASLGGSFYSDNIEDFYQTPWDLGYGRHVKFDHDFLGREALEQLQDKPHRQKVWLHWHNEDILKIWSSMLGAGDRYKYLEVPGSQYSTIPFDKVLIEDKLVGLSTYNVYTSNVRGWFSLAMVDEDQVEEGKEVSIIWGEEDGGSEKPTVEKHVQTEVRATLHTDRLPAVG